MMIIMRRVVIRKEEYEESMIVIVLFLFSSSIEIMKRGGRAQWNGARRWGTKAPVRRDRREWSEEFSF
jgi:hypothetical protein